MLGAEFFLRFHYDKAIREANEDDTQPKEYETTAREMSIISEGSPESSILSDEYLKFVPVKYKLSHVSTRLRTFICGICLGVLCLFIR